MQFLNMIYEKICNIMGNYKLVYNPVHKINFQLRIFDEIPFALGGRPVGIIIRRYYNKTV